MIHAYINYPNPHLTIHCDAGCQSIRVSQKSDQRQFAISEDSLATVLSDFIRGDVPFAATAAVNDLWLRIDLRTREQEVGVVNVIQALLGKRYVPLRDAPVSIRCGNS